MEPMVFDDVEFPTIPRHGGYVREHVSKDPYMWCLHYNLSAFIFRVDEKPIFDGLHSGGYVVTSPICWFRS